MGSNEPTFDVPEGWSDHTEERDYELVLKANPKTCYNKDEVYREF